jgi:hypothetical protein
MIEDFAGDEKRDAALRDIVTALQTQSGTEWFYVFWNSGTGGGAAAPSRPRILLSFATPDAALAFAQRNQLTGETRPRLRRLNLEQLLRTMLDTPPISKTILVRDSDTPPVGRLPQGIVVQRDTLLRRVASSSARAEDMDMESA